jgi:hypothetical protein
MWYPKSGRKFVSRMSRHSRLGASFKKRLTQTKARRASDVHALKFQRLENRILLAADVATDKLDYAPGETAVIYATDFLVGEPVKFQVLHNDGTPNTGGGHEPWQVIDGSANDLDGLRDGNIVTSWYVNPDDSLNSSFELFATGITSGYEATTTFTDSPNPNIIITLDQQGADDWTNPNQQDLSQMGFDSSQDGIIDVFWSMDDTSFGGDPSGYR